LSKLFFLIVFSARAFGAACCGGGFAAPALIAGDDKAMLTGSYLYSQIKKDVYPDGLWSDRDFNESFESFRIEGAHIFHDRWQAGASLPLVKRSRQGETSSGAGDLAATLGYEYLPDWDYNPWRPKGLGYLQLTAPTGRSVYEAGNQYQLDARGRGFWAAGIGSLLTKIWGRWDAFTTLDVHRSFAKSYANPVSRGRLKPGWGGNLAGGAGYNVRSYRFGAGLAWAYEDPVKVEGSAASEGSSERYATASLSASYLYSNDWAGTLTYADQALFGDPVNARLGQSVTLQIQRRWPR
jgi:hypothetical protein